MIGFKIRAKTIRGIKSKFKKSILSDRRNLKNSFFEMPQVFGYCISILDYPTF